MNSDNPLELVGAALAAICLKFAAKAAPTVRRFVQIWAWDNPG
jgi:hypothetical protein